MSSNLRITWFTGDGSYQTADQAAYGCL